MKVPDDLISILALKRRYILPLVTRVSSPSGPEGPPDVVSLSGIPDDGEVAHSALLAPGTGAAVVDAAGRGRVHAS